MNYSLCQLGSGQCGNMLLINALGLLLCLPFAFIHNVSAFVYVTIACLVIIFGSLMMISGNFINVINTHGVAESVVQSNWIKFPEFFGMACFSLEGIGLIFPIRGSMAKPQLFTKLFVICACCAVVFYITFGTIANFALGGATKQIIFHNFPKSYTSIFVLQLMYAIGIFTTFPMYIQACVNTIKKISFMKRFYLGKNDYRVSTLTRALMIILMFLICMTGVNLLDFMDLAGSICNGFLAFVLPVMVLLSYQASVGELSRWGKWAHVLVGAAGVVMSGVTIGFAVHNMLNRQKHHYGMYPNPLTG
jgi:proton-coupled amino acid transporter